MSVSEVQRTLLSSLLASLTAPVALGAWAAVTNLQSYERADVTIIFHYGLAIWLFSLPATVIGAVLILAIRRLFSNKAPTSVLAVAVTAALILVAYLGMSASAATTLSALACATLFVFVLGVCAAEPGSS
jgi:ABC-type proline/glycine betaine transport system permease subunit